MITVTFADGCLLATASKSLWQYDYGQQLEIVGLDLPEVFQVDFCNSGDGSTITVLGENNIVPIPDQFIATGRNISAFCFVYDETTGGTTRAEITLSVLQRPERTDEHPDPEQESVIDQLIAELNDGVERAETAADNAEQSAEGAAESETNAAESARLAKLSEDTAKESETNAAASERNAAQSEQNAAESERKAKDYADAAVESKQGADDAAERAAQSAENAYNSAINADNSARSAAESERAAGDSAENAATSERSAAESARAASDSKAAAEASKREAASSATAADESATAAAQSASAAVNAKTAAETAQEKAEAAQEATEEAEATAIAAIQAEGDTQVAAVRAEGTTQAAAVEQKGEEVLAELQEYADLPEDVSALKSAINDPVTGLDTKAPAIINSASGDIASFADGADNMPVKQLTVNFEPIQAGSGDPSPDNVRPISGRTSATVTRTGKNLWSFAQVYNPTQYTVLLNRAPFELLPGTYTFSAIPNIVSDTIVLFGYHEDGTRTEIGRLPYSTERRSATATITKKVVSLYFVSNTAGTITDIQLELGSTASAYEPYAGNTYTIQLGDTVYGGTLDVTGGKMRVTRASADMGGLSYIRVSSADVYVFRNNIGAAPVTNNTQHGLTSIYPFAGTRFISTMPDKSWMIDSAGRFTVRDDSYTDVNAFKTAMTGQTLVYELATPFEITLTPTQIDTLLGTNNIWADAGPVDVEYRADTKLYVDQKIAAAIAAALNA